MTDGAGRRHATRGRGGLDVRAAVDALLELSVVGSFSRIGPATRRRLFAWADPPGDALAGRTVLVTGPTSGLGRAATEALAAAGARVILVGRDMERLARLRDDLVARHAEDRFPLVVADMGSLASVHAAAERIVAIELRLDAVVDNAGAMHRERSESPDGIEATFAVLVAGPFALVAGLLPLLRRTPGARIISVTSGGMYTQRLDLDDLESRRGAFSGPRAYARAKRAQTALMREWAQRMRPAGIACMAMHPGWAATPGLAEALPGFYRLMGPLLRTPAEGADTIVWMAAAPDPLALSGHLFLDRRPRPFDRVPATRLTADDRRRLWGGVVALTGVNPTPGDDPALG